MKGLWSKCSEYYVVSRHVIIMSNGSVNAKINFSARSRKMERLAKRGLNYDVTPRASLTVNFNKTVHNRQSVIH